MPEVLQFEILSDLNEIALQKIDTNFEAVKAALEEQIAPYAALAVTEESVPDAKKLLARLRKLKDGINAQKIAVKKEWMAPYTRFEEEQAKPLMGIVDKGIANIDGQIKAFDEDRRAAKLKDLRQFFDTQIRESGVSDYLTWDGVFNPKWLNVTYDAETVKAEITDLCEKTNEDLDFLRGMHSEFEAAMLDEYSRSRNIKDAMNAAKRLEAIQKAESDAKAQEAAEPQERPEMPPDANLDGSAGVSTPYAAPPAQFIKTGDEPEAPKLYSLTFQLVMTAQQARALKAFLDDQGIRYHKL